MIFDETSLRTLMAETVRNVFREELARLPARAEYISVQAAADRIEVTSATIREWVRQGRLRRYCAGRELRIRVAELDALVAAKPEEGVCSSGTSSVEDLAVHDAHRDMREARRRRGE